jgi:hypothetical protein
MKKENILNLVETNELIVNIETTSRKNVTKYGSNH